MIILVMGLSGSGKTTLAVKLSNYFGCTHINADKVRNVHSDWDFSLEGRLRQAKRLRDLAEGEGPRCVVVDFICPLNEIQKEFPTDYTIWMDTVQTSKYPDTDSLFEEPKEYNYRIKDWGQESFNNIIRSIENDNTVY